VAEPEVCRWCGGIHDEVPKVCPYVKAIEFEPLSGLVTRVEFLTPADWGKQVASEAPDQEPGTKPYPTYKSLGE
jgi:hypothetical protein